MFTIKSVSDEGEYYLVNHWDKYRALWVRRNKIKAGMLFKTERSAKTSLTKLLKIMPDYKNDKFEMVKIELQEVK